jgi:hypothetical protein
MHTAEVWSQAYAEALAKKHGCLKLLEGRADRRNKYHRKKPTEGEGRQPRPPGTSRASTTDWPEAGHETLRPALVEQARRVAQGLRTAPPQDHGKLVLNVHRKLINQSYDLTRWIWEAAGITLPTNLPITVSGGKVMEHILTMRPRDRGGEELSQDETTSGLCDLRVGHLAYDFASGRLPPGYPRKRQLDPDFNRGHPWDDQKLSMIGVNQVVRRLLERDDHPSDPSALVRRSEAAVTAAIHALDARGNHRALKKTCSSVVWLQLFSATLTLYMEEAGPRRDSSGSWGTHALGHRLVGRIVDCLSNAGSPPRDHGQTAASEALTPVEMNRLANQGMIGSGSRTLLAILANRRPLNDAAVDSCEIPQWEATTDQLRSKPVGSWVVARVMRWCLFKACASGTQACSDAVESSNSRRGPKPTTEEEDGDTGAKLKWAKKTCRLFRCMRQPDIPTAKQLQSTGWWTEEEGEDVIDEVTGFRPTDSARSTANQDFDSNRTESDSEEEDDSSDDDTYTSDRSDSEEESDDEDQDEGDDQDDGGYEHPPDDRSDDDREGSEDREGDRSDYGEDREPRQGPGSSAHRQYRRQVADGKNYQQIRGSDRRKANGITPVRLFPTGGADTPFWYKERSRRPATVASGKPQGNGCQTTDPATLRGPRCWTLGKDVASSGESTFSHSDGDDRVTGREGGSDREPRTSLSSLGPMGERSRLSSAKYTNTTPNPRRSTRNRSPRVRENDVRRSSVAGGTGPTRIIEPQPHESPISAREARELVDSFFEDGDFRGGIGRGEQRLKAWQAMRTIRIEPRQTPPTPRTPEASGRGNTREGLRDYRSGEGKVRCLQTAAEEFREHCEAEAPPEVIREISSKGTDLLFARRADEIIRRMNDGKPYFRPNKPFARFVRSLIADVQANTPEPLRHTNTPARADGAHFVERQDAVLAPARAHLFEQADTLADFDWSGTERELARKEGASGRPTAAQLLADEVTQALVRLRPGHQNRPQLFHERVRKAKLYREGRQGDPTDASTVLSRAIPSTQPCGKGFICLQEIWLALDKEAREAARSPLRLQLLISLMPGLEMTFWSGPPVPPGDEAHDSRFTFIFVRMGTLQEDKVQTEVQDPNPARCMLELAYLDAWPVQGLHNGLYRAVGAPQTTPPWLLERELWETGELDTPQATLIHEMEDRPGLESEGLSPTTAGRLEYPGALERLYGRKMAVSETKTSIRQIFNLTRGHTRQGHGRGNSSIRRTSRTQHGRRTKGRTPRRSAGNVRADPPGQWFTSPRGGNASTIRSLSTTLKDLTNQPGVEGGEWLTANRERASTNNTTSFPTPIAIRGEEDRRGSTKVEDRALRRMLENRVLRMSHGSTSMRNDPPLDISVFLLSPIRPVAAEGGEGSRCSRRGDLGGKGYLSRPGSRGRTNHSNDE